VFAQYASRTSSQLETEYWSANCAKPGRGKMVEGKIKLFFDPETLKNHRWSEETLFEHFSLAVLPSAPRFLKERDEIMKRTQKYRSFLL